MNCKICNATTNRFAQAVVLNKYDIAYYHCPNCYFVQTEEPYWFKEAYGSVITDEDTGLVKRNLFFADYTANLIDSTFEKDGDFLDFGGGYGLFVRLMLDKGYKFNRYDVFCENLFAKGYDADLNQAAQYELITAFEVFEHFVSPMDEIANLLDHSNSIFFTTQLVDKAPPQPAEWSYYSLSTGQHIAFYAFETLVYIARKLGLNLYTDKNQAHLFTKKTLSFISCV